MFPSVHRTPLTLVPAHVWHWKSPHDPWRDDHGWASGRDKQESCTSPCGAHWQVYWGKMNTIPYPCVQCMTSLVWNTLTKCLVCMPKNSVLAVMGKVYTCACVMQHWVLVNKTQFLKVLPSLLGLLVLCNVLLERLRQAAQLPAECPPVGSDGPQGCTVQRLNTYSTYIIHAHRWSNSLSYACITCTLYACECTKFNIEEACLARLYH